MSLHPAGGVHLAFVSRGGETLRGRGPERRHRLRRGRCPDRPGPPQRRRAGLRRARARARLVDAERRLALRPRQGGRRGGLPGDLARNAAWDRPLRGPFVVQDLALPHPRQHGEGAGSARGSNGAVLGARGGEPRRRRADRRARAVPSRGRPVGEPLGLLAAALRLAAGRQASRPARAARPGPPSVALHAARSMRAAGTAGRR